MVAFYSSKIPSPQTTIAYVRLTQNYLAHQLLGSNQFIIHAKKILKPENKFNENMIY